MTADLSTVPLVALSNITKNLISNLLNPTKCIPLDDGTPRDWRGLAHLSGLSGEVIPNLSSKQDPCGYILSTMEENVKGFTFAEFQKFLQTLDRWDIIDDTITLMVKDAEIYKEKSERSLTSANVIENDIDEQILTYDDSIRLQQGLERQYYDAFLLFADEDVNFADEICENLENKSGLKLCRKDRDFIIGLPFEHTATMTLISERCNRLLIVVSPNFLKSSANKFFLNFAQALAIDKRQRKIIPCLYKQCKLPPELSYYFKLDYNRAGKFWDFWSKLRDSIKTPNASALPTRTTPAPVPVPESEPETRSSVEISNTCEKVCKEEKKDCYMIEKTCRITKIASESCPHEIKHCNLENSEFESRTGCEKKSKGLLRPFKKKKLTREKEIKEKCSSAELNNCESLSSLNCPSYGSSASLSQISGKKKKNFVNKCVTKVRAMMKS